MRLVLATTNAGKTRELRRMLAGQEQIDIDDLSAFRGIPVAQETGQTFAANASLKAAYYARGLGAWTLADDSGLAVDALGGKPGVHSARWAAMHGQGEGDQANNALLLRQIEAVADDRRTARFICTLALADPHGNVLMPATDWIEGRLLRAERGLGGFGYDPLFLIDAEGRTTAELEPDHKNRISHRGKAMKRMTGMILRHLAGSQCFLI